MVNADEIDTENVSTTIIIVAAVVSAVVGIIFCIGIIVAIVCIIRHSNKSKVISNGMILQPYSQNTYPMPPPYTPPRPEILKTTVNRSV